MTRRAPHGIRSLLLPRLRWVAEACDLRDIRPSIPWILPAEVEGNCGRFRVWLKGGGDRPTRVMIHGPIPATLDLVWNGALHERDQLRVKENRPLARAIFDGETRRRARQLRQHGAIEVAGGELRMAFPSKISQDMLAGALSDLLALAERLVRPGDVLQRLAENARHDWDPQVRLESLSTLVDTYAHEATTLETLRAACGDTHDEIRLQAGIALGEDGHEVLLGLASREWPSDSCSARAVAALGTRLPAEHACAILDQALRRRRVETARSCLEAIGRIGGAEVVAPLAKVMGVETGELAEVAAQALGWTGIAAAEAPLIQALGRAALRVVAVRALGYVGTVEAVLPLKEIGSAHPRDKGLQAATRQAVMDIQSRLSGASPGQLTLTDCESGQLSLPEEDAGRLSVAAEEPPAPRPVNRPV